MKISFNASCIRCKFSTYATRIPDAFVKVCFAYICILLKKYVILIICDNYSVKIWYAYGENLIVKRAFDIRVKIHIISTWQSLDSNERREKSSKMKIVQPK